MALNLNFFHELHREEYQRSRDPLKIASKAALGVIVVAVAYYFYRLETTSTVTRRADGLRAEWAKLEPAKKQAEKREAELIKGQSTHKAIMARLHSRLLVAPVLAQLYAATDAAIQLQSVSAEVQDGSTLSVQIVGVAAAAQPRRAAEDFRLRLGDALAEGHRDVVVRYDGTNSLQETEEVIETESGTLGVARFRIRVSLKAAPEEGGKTDGKKEDATKDGEKQGEAAASFPARKLEEVRKTLEVVSKTAEDVEEAARPRNAAEAARKKGMP